MLTSPWDVSEQTGLFSWVPTVQTRTVRCGDHFDAVRVPIDLAERAHRILGPHSGPVLASQYTKTWHFLLELGDVALGAWSVPGTRLLRPGTLLGIPPLHITCGRDVRWAVTPGRGQTTPQALREALTGPVAEPAASQRSRKPASPRLGPPRTGGLR